VICPVEVGEPLGNDDNCDGVDDDCDGEVDEDFQDIWVELGEFQIYAYEASRPGATAEEAGLDPNPEDEIQAYLEHRACSRAGVLPWADVTWVEAQAACGRLGARLCTAEEWSLACGGAGAESYPYGPQYVADHCNGGDYDLEPDEPGLQDGPLPNGSLHHCARLGVFDLSGNLKEWTDDQSGGLRLVRGGSYETNPPAGLLCGQRNDLKPEEYATGSIGFRCCR